MNTKIKVAIAGARGYSGLELTRILWSHPQVESVALYATEAFEPSDSWPELQPGQLQGLPIASLLNSAPSSYDCVFLALPHEASLKLAPQLLKAGMNVIDLSGVFRLQEGSSKDQAAQYEKWYRLNHNELELLSQAHYGLVPFQKEKPVTGKPVLISNPGCYATAISMALVPLLGAQLIDPQFVVVDAKSGTTGAGKKAEEKLLFSEVSENCLPYKVSSHQHEPEIQMSLQRWGGQKVGMSFTPHLLPTRRGIIASVYAKTAGAVTDSDIQKAFEQEFKNYPLVRFKNLKQAGSERDLRLSRVVGSPRTHIVWNLDGDRLTVFSLIDNLLKGAASQAVENLNGLYGWSVNLGLDHKEGLL